MPSTAPTFAQHGMVATSHPLAADIGLEVLKSGGNAIDAAIATSAAMGLMEPMSCGIGGDLFAIVYTAKDKKIHGLNASGRAPAASSISYFRDHGMKEIPPAGPLSWSVPGCVDGWDQLLKKFGTRTLSALLAPSIEYANKGFATPPVIASMWANNMPLLKQSPDATATYLPGGRSPAAGETFRNPSLAKTYQQIAQGGRDAFYNGSIADRIVAFSKSAGGLFAKDDFTTHTSAWVDPVHTDYRGHRVYELPPPGQGITALQMLNILEGFDLKSLKQNSPDWWHLFIEAKKLAYADRARFYADPEFAEVPTAELISKAYADERRKLIDPKRALTDVQPGNPKLSSDTIYLTVVDKDRNCCSLIQSNFRGFGSGLVPGDLGFALQNRGTLFALDEKHPNRLEPRKRPFHTIIPAFVTKNDKPYFVFGVMGGDMQPQGHALILVNMIDFGMNIHDAGAAPRMEHTGSATPTGIPAQGVGMVTAEKAIPQFTLDELIRRGHKIQYGGANSGGYQGILIDPATGKLQGASETRKDGKAAGY